MDLDLHRTAERIDDTYLDQLKSQNPKDKEPRKIVMKFSKWRVANSVSDARLTLPNVPKRQNLGNYVLNFKKQKKYQFLKKS